VHCPQCHIVLWRLWRDRNRVCLQCSHINRTFKNISESQNHSGKWNGGRYITSEGYAMVLVDNTSPYFEMVHNNKKSKGGIVGYIQEHRLVMAQYLGRCLKPYEIVHHKNRNKSDNRIENLELMPNQTKHLADTFKDSYIEKLENKISDLEERILSLEASARLAKIDLSLGDNEIVQAYKKL
jgi:hypothetical protein